MAHTGGYSYAVWVRFWICVELAIGVQPRVSKQAKCEKSQAKCENIITIPSSPVLFVWWENAWDFGRLTCCYVTPRVCLVSQNPIRYITITLDDFPRHQERNPFPVALCSSGVS